MSNNDQTALKVFRTRNIILPVIISLGYIGYLMFKKWNQGSTEAINWGPQLYFWFSMTFMLVGVRMISYMWRIRILSEKKLSWKASFQVISIWEFASAITPSVIGGTAVAMFLLAKERIKLGKSTAIVLVTAFMDELFFILFAPLLLFWVGKKKMFPDNSAFFSEDDTLSNVDSNYLIGMFVLGYIILLLYTLLIGYGLFFKPRAVKRLLGIIFTLPFLKKWRRNAVQTGMDIETASSELKTKKWKFWMASFCATICAWIARYLEANFVIIAFIGFADQFVLFSRSFVMWIIMMIPLTPGASGLAESSFILLFKDISQNTEMFMVLFWRSFAYFPYLILGVIVLPRWIKRVYQIHA